MRCATCGCHFCFLCFLVLPNKETCHAHVLRCPLNKRTGASISYFVDSADFDRAHRSVQISMVQRSLMAAVLRTADLGDYSAQVDWRQSVLVIGGLEQAKRLLLQSHLTPRDILTTPVVPIVPSVPIAAPPPLPRAIAPARMVPVPAPVREHGPDFHYKAMIVLLAMLAVLLCCLPKIPYVTAFLFVLLPCKFVLEFKTASGGMVFMLALLYQGYSFLNSTSLAAVARVGTECPDSYLSGSLGSVSVSVPPSCYRHYPLPHTWLQARDRCAADGARLVTIDDERENVFVSNLTGGSSYDSGGGVSASGSVWIGYYWAAEHHKFVWDNASAASTNTYTNWQSGAEPAAPIPNGCVSLASSSSSSSGNGNGLLPPTGRGWVISECRSLFSAVCEMTPMDAAPTSPPIAAPPSPHVAPQETSTPPQHMHTPPTTDNVNSNQHVLPAAVADDSKWTLYSCVRAVFLVCLCVYFFQVNVMCGIVFVVFLWFARIFQLNSFFSIVMNVIGFVIMSAVLVYLFFIGICFYLIFLFCKWLETK